MRHLSRFLIVGLLLLAPEAISAQRLSPEAERATLAYRKGWEFMRMEAFADAAKRFREAIEIDRKFALAHYSLGRAHMALKQFAEAVKAYSTAKDLFLARSGQEFSSQMEVDRYRDEQILQYKEAIRQATSPSTGQRGGGGPSQTLSLYLQHLQRDLRDLEQARARNTTNIVLAPEVPFYVSMSLGAAYFRLQRFADAEREYKAAIAANPNSGETHNNLAVLYMLTDRFDEAANAIAAAEKTGYKVNPGLKEELKQKMGK